jgi:hypothetical protein
LTAASVHHLPWHCFSPTSIFLIKVRSTVISFKKKQQFNITRHTRTTHTTKHYTTTAWEKSQRSRHNLRRYHQRCATTKAANRCKLKWPPELLHHELSPSSCTHKVVDLSALTLLRRNTPFAAPMKPPIPATLREGPASSTASLLCQELGYLRLLRKGHLYSAITKITTAPSVATRGYTPWALRTSLPNTDKAHHHNCNTQGNTTS